MRLKSVSTALVWACALTVPLSLPANAAPAAAPAAAVVAAANSPMSLAAAKKKPAATVTATFTSLSNGKVVVRISSNAAKVQIKYRTAKNKKKSTTKKLKRGAVKITLPVGSKTITVRAKATKKLAASPWTTANPPEDTTAPGPVTGLTAAAATTSSISLSWTNPVDADLAQVIVRRARGTTAPDSPTAGMEVPLSSATANAVTDTGLDPDTGYAYSVFTRDATGNTSSVVTLAGRTAAVLNAATIRVSVASDGTQANNWSSDSTVSADGRYVAFTSGASNLVPGDTNNQPDVFLRDRETGTTTRVSVASNGTQSNGALSPALGGSAPPAISAAGRYIAFTSSASNLVDGDTNNSGDVFVHDLQTGATTRVSVGTGGIQLSGDSDGPAISGDGRYVAFENVGSVFVYDRQAGTTARVSVASNGTEGNNTSFGPAISADGRYIAFISHATNLVDGDTNNEPDVFVHDQQTGATTRDSVGTGNAQANDSIWAAAISGDGRYVAFSSYASNLVDADVNDTGDVFVRDRQSATTTRVSVGTGNTEANGASAFPAISGDGRYVTYASDASNLVGGDTNSSRDVFVHDRQTGSTTRVSIAFDDAQANGASVSPALFGSAPPSISADGRFVSFQAVASNLVPEDTNSVQDVFVRRMS